MALNHEVNGSPVEVKHLNIQAPDVDYTQSGTGSITVDVQNSVLNSLTLDGAAEQRNLPEGHQQLDYLQGDGTAYIQTPVEPTDTTGMKIVFEYGTAGGSGAICGTFNGVAPRKDTFFVSTNSGTLDTTWAFIAQAGNTLTSTDSEAPVAGKTYTALINYKNSRTFGFEGFTQKSIGSNGVLANKVLLFARLNIANNNITASNCKIKYVEFTEGTTVTHIYIPARFNNTLGLYDKITGAFLTNTNTSGTFTAGADVVPTPDTPIDIVCNNGVLKARHQSGLPLGYTLLDYIESTGTQYIDTGITDITNSEFEVVAQQTSTGGSFPTILGAVDGSSSSLSYKVICGLSSTANCFYSQCGDSTGFIVSSTPNDTAKHTFKVTTTTNKQTFQVDNTAEVVGDYAITNTTQYSLTICARNKTTVSNFTSQKVYLVRAKKNGVLIQNLIPAKRNSDNVLGMYDTVSGQFFTNAGTGTFTAGNTVSDPVEIYTDGTVETVKDSLNNTAVAEMLLKVGTYQDVQSVLDGEVTRNVGIKVLDGSEDWTIHTSGAMAIDVSHPLQIQTIYGICTHFEGVPASVTAANMTIGQFKLASTTNDIFFKTSYDNTTSWKNWLADQYANGTPVIIVYPLATATTETVTGQTLAMQNGTNTVEIIESSINNLPLTINYTAIGTKAVNYVVKDDKLVFADSNLYLKGPVNYTLSGSGQVSDGILLSGAAFVAKPTSDIWAQSSFEMCWAFRTGDTMPDSATFFSFPRSNGTVSTVGGGYFYKPNNNRLTLSLGYDSNGNSISYGFNLSTNSKYKVKMVKSNGVITASYSVNGGAFTEIGNDGGDNSTTWPSSYSSLEFYTLSNGDMKIDFTGTYFMINGSLYFYGKNYATQNIAPVPSGYTYGNTITSAIGFVDMRTQQFTAAPSGATIGRD